MSNPSIILAPQVATRGRFAPSPTGPLHLGNIRTALLAWLQVRLTHGIFILRIEDLDEQRTRSGAATAILHDLRWLGLGWDEGPQYGGPYAPYTQSERLDQYEAHLRRLLDLDAVYPCYCSRLDVQRAASAPHGPGADGPNYPGTCRDPDARSRQARLHPERKPAYRFKARPGTIAFHDAVYGRYVQDAEHDVGDFVVWRADGVPAYQLATAVDDALMRITDVVRGADLLSSTARQLALLQALEYRAPVYWHVPLLLDAHGKRLSKREAATAVTALREAGHRPAQVLGSLAASLGLVPQGTECSAEELARACDVQRLLTVLRAAAGNGML